MKTKTTLALTGVIAAMLAQPAYAEDQPWTVFGLALGQPVALPTCQHTVLPDGRRSQYIYEADPAQMCHEPDSQLSDAPWRRGSVNFPLKQMPLILRYNTGFTEIVDGKLEGLKFETCGYADTETIMAELVAKFGPPTYVGDTTQTIAGLAVPAVETLWELPDLYVEYINIGQTVDYGTLLIETPVMRALRDQRLKQQAAQRRQL